MGTVEAALTGLQATAPDGRVVLRWAFPSCPCQAKAEAAPCRLGAAPWRWARAQPGAQAGRAAAGAGGAALAAR